MEELQKQLNNHEMQDTEQFRKIQERFDNQDEMLLEIKDFMAEARTFMADLNGVKETVVGVGLLKKPALWVLALIVGIVTLTGGLKAMILGILSWVK